MKKIEAKLKGWCSLGRFPFLTKNRLKGALDTARGTGKLVLGESCGHEGPPPGHSWLFITLEQNGRQLSASGDRSNGSLGDQGIASAIVFADCALSTGIRYELFKSKACTGVKKRHWDLLRWYSPEVIDTYTLGNTMSLRSKDTVASQPFG